MLVLACSTQKKARTLREKSLGAGLSLPREKEIIEPGVQSSAPRRDTLKVKDLDGTELLIMRAVKDEATGEMVASEVLDAAVLGSAPSLTYAKYQSDVKPRPRPKAEERPIIGWKCKICGYVYEGAVLPADFLCPLCAHPAEDFEPIYG